MPLYVFLHGLTVVRQQGNDLEVVLPKVPGHVQKAGGWLAETDIVSSDLVLQGVATGTTKLPWDGMLYLPGTTLTSLSRAATLHLPVPRDVLGLLCACPTMPPYPPPQPLPPDEDYVVRTKTGGSVFKRVPSVHVLVYDFSDQNEVRLDNHSWEPYSNSNDDSISLHVISTSLEREGQGHEDATEAVMSQVLQGYPGLEFKKNPRPLAAPWIDPMHDFYFYKKQVPPNTQVPFPEGDHMLERAGGPFAFALAELEHPTARMLRLERLGMMVRSQRSIAGLWSDPDVLGDRVCNCATTGTP